MYIISFLFSLHVAIPAYIGSTFLSNVISEKYVGLIFALASLITLIVLSESSIILKHFGNRKFTLDLLLLNLIGLMGLITSHNPFILASAFILFTITNTLFAFCIDIFIEHFGTVETIGKTRGFYLTITNGAWMVSPLIALFLMSENSDNYTNIFIFAFFAVVAALISLITFVPKFKDKTYTRTSFYKTFQLLKKNKRILHITMINFILQFFFTIMIIYAPIYLHKHLGLPWSQISVIFAIMLSSFVIFPPIVGFLVDKYKVNKLKILTIGLLIMGLATILVSCIYTTNVVIWTIIMFITRIGASVVESTSDIYFFTHIKEEEAQLLGVYRDMYPLAYLIAPVIASAFILLFPLRYLFILLGVIVLFGLLYIPKLKKHNGN